MQERKHLPVEKRNAQHTMMPQISPEDEAVMLKAQYEAEAQMQDSNTVEIASQTVETVQPTNSQVETQKVETEEKETQPKIEETEKPKMDAKKIADIIELKRAKRAEKKAEAQEDYTDTEEVQKIETIDVEALKEELRAEFEDKLNEAKQYQEVNAKLQQEVDIFKSERAEKELRSLIDSEVKNFTKTYPQAELMIDNQYLVDLVLANETYAHMTVDDLILKVYPNSTRSVKMDSYGTSKAEAKPMDFSNLESADIERIAKDPKLQEQYTRFISSHL